MVSLIPGVRDSLAVHAAPLLVFTGGALLGIATGRGRLVLGLMVLALTMAALINFGSHTTFPAVALLLPLNLGVIAWLGETRAQSARGASWLGVILLQAAAVGLVEFLQPAARFPLEPSGPWLHRSSRSTRPDPAGRQTSTSRRPECFSPSEPCWNRRPSSILTT